jgi:hypothetical protein
MWVHLIDEKDEIRNKQIQQLTGLTCIFEFKNESTFFCKRSK